jgi:hypothetical protein
MHLVTTEAETEEIVLIPTLHLRFLVRDVDSGSIHAPKVLQQFHCPLNGPQPFYDAETQTWDFEHGDWLDVDCVEEDEG